MEKKQVGARKRHLTIAAWAFAAVAFSAALLAVSHWSGKGGQDAPSVTEAKDTKENLNQREKLFAHIGASTEDYEETNSRCTGGTLCQWWYKNKVDGTQGLYVAVGDVKKNGGGFAEFDESGIVIQGDEDYELEIASGAMAEDGFLDSGTPMRSYYFVQAKDSLEFVNLVESE